MGSSKYEFEPWKFEEDIQKKIAKHKQQEKETLKTLEKIINQDTYQLENFRMITKALRTLKEKYDL
ncbi:hypothetical protein [Clostridium botulinum]|uniref:hypothetical protein n=1 Tax=Clostridium botulinum TaxID=1491 RepID=UPI001FCDC4BD|nr:hypothetical protein [Clostridium botulinum]